MFALRSRAARAAAAAAIASAGLIGVLTGAAHASTAAGAVKPAAIVPGDFHPIRNVSSAQCLQPVSSAPTSPVEQTLCNGSAAQNWQFVSKSGTHYIFINQSDAECLYAAGDTVNGTTIAVGTCNDSNAEWNASTTLSSSTQRQFALSSREHFRDNNFCLTAATPVQIIGCTGTADQQWLYPGEF